jgi:hypothetical protein
MKEHIKCIFGRIYFIARNNVLIFPRQYVFFGTGVTVSGFSDVSQAMAGPF